MKTIALQRIDHKKLLRSGISSKLNDSHFLKSRLAWEKRNQAQILKYLENWQFIIANFLKDGIFAYGIYEYFKLNLLKTKYYNFRISGILLYLQNVKHFNLQYTKLVNNCSTQTISSSEISKFIKETKVGVVIDGVRIFPELYFPFMDEQYYNHFDWNKKIVGVGIADLDEFQLEKNILYLNKSDSDHNENSCNCKKDNQPNMPIKESIHKVSYEMSEYSQNLDNPIIFIGYTNGITIISAREKADCYCSQNELQVEPGCQLTFHKTFCGKARSGANPCSHGDSRCKREKGNSISSNF